MTRAGDRIDARGEVDGDGYPEFARTAYHLVIHGATPETVRVDGTELRMADGHFAVPNAGDPVALEFDLTA